MKQELEDDMNEKLAEEAEWAEGEFNKTQIALDNVRTAQTTTFNTYSDEAATAIANAITSATNQFNDADSSGTRWNRTCPTDVSQPLRRPPMLWLLPPPP